MELSVDSHAKINLALLIKGKFPDGYHRLETIFQRVSLKDEITLREIPGGIRITSDVPGLPLDETNLAFRAARKIMVKTGMDKGVAIHLEKRIPMGAGLGGGSSNAAAVLKGLNQMWGLGLPREDLSSLGTELGADVPFFLYDNCAFGSGRGDRLESISSRCRMWVVLVHPGISISTAWVYGHFRMELTNKGDYIKILRISLQENKIGQIPKNLVNDLEPVVFPAYPEVKEIKAELLQNGAAGALMSGSGSTVFGLFTERASAIEALEKLAKGKRTIDLAEFVV